MSSLTNPHPLLRAQNVDTKTNNFVEEDKSPLLNDGSRKYQLIVCRIIILTWFEQFITASSFNFFCTKLRHNKRQLTKMEGGKCYINML